MKIRHFLPIALLLMVAGTARAQVQTTIRVCTYNVLNFGTQETPQRVLALLIALDILQPDLLVVQNLTNQAGITAFIDSLATLGHLSLKLGFDGPDSDNGILLTNKIEYLNHVAHPTALRNVDEFILRVKGTSDTLHVFTCNLKAGDTYQDSLDRIQEAMIVRRALDTIPKHHHHIVAGDLNVYTSSEEAYQVLTRIGIVAAGEVFDPINRPGDWHANQEFAGIHTQSTRVRQFGGGATGGMDDRFDFVLLSGSLLPKYVTGTYTAFGNDGKHFNDSITAGVNDAVHPFTAQALHDASDHVPVYLDLRFTTVTSAVEERKQVPAQMDLSHRER